MYNWDKTAHFPGLGFLSVKAIEKRMSLALEHLKTHLKDKVNGIILFFVGFRFCWDKIRNASEAK